MPGRAFLKEGDRAEGIFVSRGMSEQLLDDLAATKDDAGRHSFRADELD